jgi:hypothetical protein
VFGTQTVTEGKEAAGNFNPVDCFETYDSMEDFAAPLQSKLADREIPPLVIPNVRLFS